MIRHYGLGGSCYSVASSSLQQGYQDAAGAIYKPCARHSCRNASSSFLKADIASCRALLGVGVQASTADFLTEGS